MPSPTKALAIAGGALLLALLGVVIAVLTVDPKHLMAPVLARVKAATGRDVTVGGGMELKLGLVPKITANDVRIGNAPWGRAPDLLTAKRLEMQVALLPLLRRNFELVRLQMIEPVIALETDAEGRQNWELGAKPDAGAAPMADARPGALAIGALAIERGELSHRAAAGGPTFRVTIDELALSVRDARAPVEATFRGTVDGTAVALTATLGPLATLADRRLPYPVSAQGEVAGRKAAVAVKVVRADDHVELQDVDATFGSSNVKGRVDIRDDGQKSTWTVNLASSAFAVDDLPALGAAPAAKPAAARAGSSRYVFSDAAVSFDALRATNANGEVTIGRLELADGRTLDRVHARFAMRDGRLDVPALQATAYGGTLSGSLAVDARRGRAPEIALRVEGRELDLAALLAAAGVPREVRGGKTSLSVDVTMRGESPHQWVSGINGRLRAVVGPATLVNTRIDPAVTLDRLAEAVNPFRSVDPSTELRCAVIRLPLAGGVARIDRSIAMETKQIDAAVSGTLDFRNETLDLSIRPRVRQGLPIEIPQIAELVRLRGSFAAPTVAVDAVASAATIARIGAAIGTSGLSVLGETLVAQGASSSAGACDVALGKASSAPASPPAEKGRRASPPPATDDLSKALKGLFGR
jgi:uncharacterized protein involved in outer membrane biogenesis